MIELEDLREATLDWQAGKFFKRSCEIFSHDRPVGYLRPKGLGRGYYAELGGLAWQIRTARQLLWAAYELGFAGRDFGLATCRLEGVHLIASVDGSRYQLRHEEPQRGVWRDQSGYAAVSFRKKDQRTASGRLMNGSLNIFSACPAPHAPPLALFSLHQAVYRHFFWGDNEGAYTGSGAN